MRHTVQAKRRSKSGHSGSRARATPTRSSTCSHSTRTTRSRYEATEGLRRVVSPPQPRTVTAVRNWNAAAARFATGHILFVIADDLTPPVGWDTVSGRDRRHTRSLLDSPLPYGSQTSIRGRTRAPRCYVTLVSRRFYEAHGLFDPEYTSLFCDDDITLRSFHRAVVVDGSSLRLQHHRSAGRPTPSQSRINTDEELAHGRRVRDRKWKRSRLPSPRAFFRPPRVGAMVRPWAVIWRLQLRARSLADAPRRADAPVHRGGQLRARRLRALGNAKDARRQPTDRR